MMRVLMLPAAASILLIGANLLCAPAANAVQSPSPGATDQPSNIPDEKLDAAAAAIQRVTSLKQDYQQRITAAAPADKERILNEANSALEKELPTKACRSRNSIQLWKWRRTIPSFAQKFVSAFALRPNSCLSTRPEEGGLSRDCRRVRRTPPWGRASACRVR